MDPRYKQIFELRGALGDAVREIAEVKRACSVRACAFRLLMAEDALAIAELRAENADLELEVKQLNTELGVHESYNHSTRDAKLFAKDRRDFRGKEAKRKAEEGGEHQAEEGTEGQGAGQKRRGHRPGTPGVSHSDKPTFTKKFKPETCGNCGRTDVLPYETKYKTVTDNAECGEELCYTEELTSVVCMGCGAVTKPEGDSLPGSACGPRRRFLISNMHDAIPAVRVIQKLLLNNHGIKMSTGAISNCLAAIARFALEGNRPVVPEQHAIAISRSPLPWNGAGGADTSTVWSGLARPALMERLEDMASMSPHVEFDESHANVAGGYAQALVLLASGIVIIHIESGRSKETIQRLFGMALRRPLVADKYRGGHAFAGEYQTCLVHITRFLESLAIKFGVESPECVLYRMFDAIRHDSKVTGLEITRMVGGPNTSACDTGRVVNNPEARAYADGQKAALEERVKVVAHGYAAGPVSDEESRKAAGSLLRALPYMFTSFYHPGMTNNSNGVERTVRQYHVRPRTIQRILPDWKAARTAAILRSVYATCGINGWVPGEVLSGRSDADPFSAGIPPPIFNPDRRGARPHPDASGGHPFAMMEKNRRFG